MGAFVDAILEKVFGSAVARATARRTAESVVKTQAERTAATTVSETTAATAEQSARATYRQRRLGTRPEPSLPADAPVAQIAPAAETPTTWQRMSRFWNLGRPHGDLPGTFAGSVSGRAVRGTGKILAAGLAYEAATTAWPYVQPSVTRFLTEKRPDQTQRGVDDAARRAEQPAAGRLRDDLAHDRRAGEVPPLVQQPEQTLSDEDKARRNAAERKAVSETRAQIAANIGLYSAAGPASAAERMGQTTWGKYLARVLPSGDRQLIYENASPAGRSTLLFRSAQGAETRVEPKNNVFTINDPRLLGNSAVLEIQVFRIGGNGAVETTAMDTISIDQFPAPHAAPRQRSEMPRAPAPG